MAADLIDLNRVRSILTTITDDSSNNLLQTLLTAASRAAETWCKRNFSMATYDELYDSDGSGSLFLRNFPVIDVQRVSMTRSNLIAIRNNDNVTNSRAWLKTTQILQEDVPTQTIGLMLQRVAGGLTVTDATLRWNDYPTVRQLADAINNLGFGWQAIVQSNYGNWATADITPLQGQQNALNTSGNLYAHTTDLNDYDVVAETGEIRFTGSFAQLFGTGWVPNQFPGGDLLPGLSLPRGSRNIRVVYSAGFNVIPENVQQAVALWTSSLLQQPTFSGNLTSETLADYSYQRAVTVGPPPDVKSLLLSYRDWRI